MSSEREIKTRITLAGDGEYRKSIKSVNDELKLLSSELKLVSQSYKNNSGDVDGLKKRHDLLKTSYEKQTAAIEATEKELERCKELYGDTDPKVRRLETSLVDQRTALVQVEQELSKVDTELEKSAASNADAAKKVEYLKEKYDKLSDTLSTVGKDLDKAAQATKGISTAAAASFAALVGGSAKAAIDFESAFAGVRKTVNGTEEQFAELEQGIRDMAKEVPASANSIAGVAEAAGQLGIKTENILDFSRTMIDLGEATNLTGEEAATTFAQFANLTKMDQSKFSNLGSAIVALGNNFATTEKDIAAMSARLGGAGTQIGLTQPEILGIATALSSVGVEAQAGGTAFSKVFSNMQIAVEKGGKGLNDFASVAGMTTSEFAKAFKEKPAEAIQSFIVGLAHCEDSGNSAIMTLSDMGITQDRLRDSLLRSANASEMFTGAIATANSAFAENTALSAEAEQRYKTTASQLSILKNELIDAGIEMGGQMLPVLKELIEKLKVGIKWFSGLTDGQKKLLLGTLAVTAALSPALKLGSNIFKVLSTGAQILQGVRVATTGVKDATLANTVAQKAYNIAVKANPVMLLVTGLAALAAAALAVSVKHMEAARQYKENIEASKKLKDETDELTKAYDENSAARQTSIGEAEAQGRIADDLAKKIENLASKENKSAEEKSQLHSWVAQLNEIVPDLGLAYDEVTDALNKTNEEIDNNIEAMQKQALTAAYQTAMSEATQELVKNEQALSALTSETGEYTVAQQNLATAQKAVDEYMKGTNVSTMDSKYKELARDVQDAQTAFDNVDGSLTELSESVAKNHEEIDSYSKKAIEAAANYDTMISAAEDTGKAIPDHFRDALQSGQYKVEEGFDDMASLMDYDSMINDASVGGDGAITKLTEAINSKKMSPADALREAQSYIEYKGMWTTADEAGLITMQSLEKGVQDGSMLPSAAVQAAKDAMGVIISDTTVPLAAGGADVQAYADGMNANLGAATASAQGINNQASAILGQPQNWNASGLQSGAAVGTGIRASASGVEGAASAVANKGVDATKAIFTLQSPAAGKVLPEGIAKGITTSAGQISTAATDAANGGVSAAGDVMRSQSPGIGLAFDQGMANGMIQNSGIIQAAARKVAQDALDASKSQLGVESPSKETHWIGEMLDAGLANGIIDGLANVRSAMRGVRSTVLTGLDGMDATVEMDTRRTYTPRGGSGASGGKVINMNVSQTINAERMSYADIQREAAKQFKQIAREVS